MSWTILGSVVQEILFFNYLPPIEQNSSKIALIHKRTPTEHIMNTSIKQLEVKINHQKPLINKLFDHNTSHCKRCKSPQFLLQANNEQMINTAENNVKVYCDYNSRYSPTLNIYFSKIKTKQGTKYSYSFFR